MSNLDYPLKNFQDDHGVDLNGHVIGSQDDVRAYTNGDTRAFVGVALATASQGSGIGRVGFARMGAAEFGRPQSGTRVIYLSQQVLDGIAGLGAVGQALRDSATKSGGVPDDKGSVSAVLCPSPDLFVSAIVLLTGIHRIGNLEPLALPYFGRFLRTVGFTNIPRLLATAQWLQGSTDRLDNFILVGGRKPTGAEELGLAWFANTDEAQDNIAKGSVVVLAPSTEQYSLHLKTPCIVVGTIAYATDRYSDLRLTCAVSDDTPGAFVALDGLNVTPNVTAATAQREGELIAPSFVISHCRLQARTNNHCDALVLRANAADDGFSNQITLNMCSIGQPSDAGAVLLTAKFVFVHACGLCAPLFLHEVYGAHVHENVLYAPLVLRGIRGGPGSVLIERNVVPGEDIEPPPSWSFAERNGLRFGFWLSMDQHTWSTAMPHTSENRVREDLVQVGIPDSVGKAVLAVLLMSSVATSGVFVDGEAMHAGTAQEVATIVSTQSGDVVINKALCKLFVVLGSLGGNMLTKPIDAANGPGGVLVGVGLHQHAGLRPFVNASHGVLMIAPPQDPFALGTSFVVSRPAFLVEEHYRRMQLAHAIDRLSRDPSLLACLPTEADRAVEDIRRLAEQHRAQHNPPELTDGLCHGRALVPGPEPQPLFVKDPFAQFAAPRVTA